MIIAIPSVTKYINDSRENAYIKTAKSIMNGARNLVHSGNLDVSDKNTTYYIPVEYIEVDNVKKSPYGEFEEAYVGVISNDDSHSYYWISVDSQGIGVENVTLGEKIDVDDIKTDLNVDNIRNRVETTGIGNRNIIKILDVDTGEWILKSDNPLEYVSEEGNILVCKRAITLHTAVCSATEDGCFAGGFVEGNKGVTITYGSIPSGEPVRGNAYDCKVRKDSGYTERFYYMTSDGDNSILLYYRNINGQQGIAYDTSNENWHGPRDAYQILPSVDEWDNPELIAPGTRMIKTNYGASATGGGTIESFTYTNKAARFLTNTEAREGCGSSLTGYGIDKCNYLLESLGRYETGIGVFGYWLENPLEDAASAANIVGSTRHISSIAVRHNGGYGVRPVITVKTSNIE